MARPPLNGEGMHIGRLVMSFWTDFAAGQRDVLLGRPAPVSTPVGYEVGRESVEKEWAEKK
jgi:hypothetical protein